MADKAPAFVFTTNVPVNVDIRFVDVRPGKPWDDPKKGRVTLPAQVSIKGTLGGTETIAFLKGKVWANIKALAAAGVIAEEWAARTDELDAVDKVTSIPVLHGKVTATLQKLPTDRWENMVYAPIGSAPAHTPKRISYAEANTPTGASAPSVGGPIKGLDDFPSEEYAASVQSPDESPYDEPGPLPPFHKPSVSAKPAEIAPVATEKAKIVRAYLDLFAWMKSQPEMGNVPADVVQSASATIWIEWNRRGLVK